MVFLFILASWHGMVWYGMVSISSIWHNKKEEKKIVHEIYEFDYLMRRRVETQKNALDFRIFFSLPDHRHKKRGPYRECKHSTKTKSKSKSFRCWELCFFLHFRFQFALRFLFNVLLLWKHWSVITIDLITIRWHYYLMLLDLNIFSSFVLFFLHFCSGCALNFFVCIVWKKKKKLKIFGDMREEKKMLKRNEKCEIIQKVPWESCVFCRSGDYYEWSEKFRKKIPKYFIHSKREQKMWSVFVHLWIIIGRIKIYKINF